MLSILVYVTSRAELNAKNRIEIYRTGLEILKRQRKCIWSALIDLASLGQHVYAVAKHSAHFLTTYRDLGNPP